MNRYTQFDAQQGRYVLLRSAQHLRFDDVINLLGLAEEQREHCRLAIQQICTSQPMIIKIDNSKEEN